MATANKAVEKTYAFTLVYNGPSELTQELEDAIFEAGCDDALLGIVAGQMTLDFHRKAPSFQEALTSAIADVGRAGLSYPLVRVEPI